MIVYDKPQLNEQAVCRYTHLAVAAVRHRISMPLQVSTAAFLSVLLVNRSAFSFNLFTRNSTGAMLASPRIEITKLNKNTGVVVPIPS